jgi:transporter family-2 protein
MSYLMGLVALSSCLVTIQNGQNARLGTISSPLFSAACIYLIQIFVSGIFYIFYQIDSFEAPLWAYLGGPIMAIFIISIGITTEILGQALSISCMLTTQMIMGAVVDNFGLFGIPVLKLTIVRTILIAISILAVILISFDPTKKQGKVFPGIETDAVVNIVAKEEREGMKIPKRQTHIKRSVMVAVALSNGILLTVGSSIIGALGNFTSGSYSSFLSSVLGFSIILVLLIIDTFVMKNTFSFTLMFKKAEWWVYLIGWAGGLYTIVLSYLLPGFGASLFFGISNSFQIITAMVCDHFGLFGVAKSKVTTLGFLGAIAIMISTILLLYV